jgi:hypothetical protein
MRAPPLTNQPQQRLTSYFWSDDAIRSRNVSDVVVTGTVDVPELPARLIADWDREIAQRLELEPGDVETLPLARARMRWPDYGQCVQAVSDWVRTLGLQDVLLESSIALMACRGAKYHHDGEHYGGAAFCNLFLSEDKGLDLHFPSTGHRIALVKGTAVIFDTCQPHAVIQRHRDGFRVADFPPERDCTLIFLTWELPIENADVGLALQIEFDTASSTPLRPNEEQLWLDGARIKVHPDSGRWCRANDEVTP